MSSPISPQIDPSFDKLVEIAQKRDAIAHSTGLHQGNVGAWSKVVLNAPGPPTGVVVPLVPLVHSDPL